MTLTTDQAPNDTAFSVEAKLLLSIRDAVFDRWEASVRMHIKGAAELLGPALTDNLPTLYDNLAEAISPDIARRTATEHTTAAKAHGSERARLTCFGPDEVLREYQLFRDAIRHEVHARGACWSDHIWAAIGQSIEIAACESLREYANTQEALRRRMAAALSHDMRNPLSIINASAQLIARCNDITVSRGLAEKLQRQATRLEAMMGELLDALTVVRDELPSLALSRFDMRDLTQDVAQQFDGSGARLIVSGESVTGYWVAHAVRRALENLISNALKYGDGGGVHISTATTRGRVSLSVHNTGPVIPAERQEHIFGYLHRYGAPGVVGWGIGLPFVRGVAEGHGGSVSVDSSVEGGTTFMIDMPIDCRQFVAHTANCSGHNLPPED